MNLIASSENKLYKNLSKLDSKKHRDTLHQYLIEGPNLLKEALENGAEIELVVLKNTIVSGGKKEEIAIILNQLEEKSISRYCLEDRLFEKIAQTETTQGVIAVVKKVTFYERDFFSIGKVTTSGNIIVLDRLQDPGNIGTILRTADGAGFAGAILIKGTADVYSPKVVRAATGSLFRLPLLQVDTAEECLEILNRNQKTSICTALDGAINYFDCDMKKDIAIVIGNEGNGVSPTFLEHCHKRVKIPMIGTIESLNAAVAAGILMYESVRK